MTPDRWVRVKTVFHAALDRAPNERAAFAVAACADDAALYAEVERLLEAHAEAGSFIECSPASASSDSLRDNPVFPLDASPNGPARQTLTGRVIGHYEVGRLGVAGMGEVYAARDLELGMPVALKVGIGTDADAHSRQREAEHASQLNHPHICTIYEVGVFDGQLFIAMELVDGQRLSDLVPPAGLPIDEVARYGIQIADALAHAHRGGVIHRDLKSANVVITLEGRAKVLDFGLARRLSPQLLKALSQSLGLVADTLSCMAPELLRGEPADARSDIWAFGVLLNEMATGRKPFTGATGFELSGAILHQPPPPADHVLSPLNTIINQCLAKNPHDRYQNAGEVRTALETVQMEAPS